MTQLSVALLDTAFTPFRGDEAPYKLVPKRYTKKAIGGPRSADIQVIGGATSVWEVVELLRYAIEITDREANKVWWGYINSVDIQVGRYRFGVSMDSMGNVVTVAYGQVKAGAATGVVRATTAAINDPDSISFYGIKEKAISIPSATDSAALALAAQELAQYKLPVPTIALNSSGSSAVSATLSCKGWWDTSDWRYASQPADQTSHEETNSNEVFVAVKPAGPTMVAQSFVPTGTTAWVVGAITIKARIKGAPVGTLRVELRTDSGGVPSATVLDYADFNASSFSTYTTWVESLTATNAASITPGTTYWLVYRVLGGGTWDASNYYEVEGSKFNVYTSGAAKQWNGSVWVDPSVDNYDFLFIVSGIRPSTSILSQILTTYGQFFTSVIIQDASNLYISAYLDGDSTTLQEAESILELGTDQQHRLLVDVDSNRIVTVYQEPAATEGTWWYIDSQGKLYSPYHLPVRAHTCPVAYWAKLDDVIPSSVNTSRISDPSLVFIDEAEYDVDSGIYIPHPRGKPSVWSGFGRIRRV